MNFKRWIFFLIAPLSFIVFAFMKAIFGLYYTQMTHLSDNELKWASCVTEYPDPYFEL